MRKQANDTIVAIATAVGESGIGIVRLSGKDALKTADKLFVAKDGARPSSFKSYTTHYGWIKQDTEIVDEVLLTVMRSPRSYTREDVVEINCHGGVVALRKALDLVSACGVRLAEPGEFTERAFLNGRIDLAQAEAVLDIIRAKTDSALKISSEQLRGGLSQEINKTRRVLLEIAAQLEAQIDFPEEEIGSADSGHIRDRLSQASSKLKELLVNAKQGRVMREGLRVVICGKPNAGKSSLLNALLREERSIVTPVAGTTRDSIEEIIDIRGIPIRIVDTAGMLEPRDLIEKKAVQRSARLIDLADLVLLVFDASTKLSAQDRLLMRRLKNKPTLAIINKIDLKKKIEREQIRRVFPRIVEISAKKIKNIPLLEEAIGNLFFSGKLGFGESIMVSNTRHILLIKEAQKLIAQAVNSLDNKLSAEFITQDIKEALSCLDGLLGKRFSEDLLDKIFSDFCIGK